MTEVTAPAGAPEGGKYVEIKYCGVISWVIVLLSGCCCLVPMCPCDKKDYYIAPDGSLWTRNGASASEPFCMKR